MGKKLTQEEVQNRINNYFIQDVILISEYKNKRTPVRLKCNECNYEWEMIPHNFLYVDNKKATHRCPNCGNVKDGEYFKCAYCGKEIFRTRHQIEKNQSGYFYCSRECGNLHKNQLRKEAGEWDNSLNYRLRAFENYEHKCAVCGWDEDERVLEVHHLDEDRSHNQLNNLIILCPTCHKKLTLHLYELTADNKLVEK